MPYVNKNILMDFIDNIFKFSVLWLLAAVQLGPNALNCIYVAAFKNSKMVLCVIVGILTVSVIYMELIYLHIIQWCGIIWIAYLGFVKLMARKRININFQNNGNSENYQELWREYKTSVIISATNPKVFIFYLSIFAQFIGDRTDFISDHIYFAIALAITFFVYYAYALIGKLISKIFIDDSCSIPADFVSGIAYMIIAVFFCL